MNSSLKVLISLLMLLLFARPAFAKDVYRCEINGTTTYQAKPCRINTIQKLACVNYATASNFKKSLEGKECLDNGVNSNGYGGYSSGYSSTSSGSYYGGSSYSSGGTKSQRVSGYTRKDGTHVKSYTRSRK